MAGNASSSAIEPLVRAALDGDLERLRRRYPASGDDERARALANAAAAAKEDSVRELLSLGADPNRPAEIVGYGFVAPPLYFALRHGRPAIARRLVESGADIDATEPRTGHPIVSELVHDGCPLEILEVALDLGADLDGVGRSGYTPLCAALDRGRSGAARWLVEQGADPNVGRCAQEALRGGGIGAWRLLLEAGLDLDRRYEPDVTLLELAAEYNRPEVFDYLRARGGDPSSLEPDLPLAASAGLESAVRRLIEEDAHPVDRPDRHGRTPLAMAVASGRTEVVRFLLEVGAEPNQQFRCEWREPDWGGLQSGDHPIDFFHEDHAGMLEGAVRRGDLVAAALLLDAGADPNAAPATWTPLHFAGAQGDSGLVELLLLAGADLEARNAQGNTPLLIAVDSGQRGVLGALREAGADLFAVDEEGHDALAVAALGNRAELVEILVEAGLDPNRANHEGQTPLMLAAEMGSHEALRTLLRNGADPSRRDPEGRTALDLAIETRDALFADDPEEWDAMIGDLRANS